MTDAGTRLPRYCHQCGGQVEEAAFCGSCGARQDTRPQAEPSPDSTDRSEVSQSHPQHRPSQPGTPGTDFSQPQQTGALAPVDHPRGLPILALGILGLLCFAPLAIAAWLMGNSALREIDAQPNRYANRQSVQVGRVLGIVGTVLAVIGVILVLVWVLLLGGAVAYLNSVEASGIATGTSAVNEDTTAGLDEPGSAAPQPDSTPAEPGHSGAQIRIGIKFDQPGIGLRDGAEFTGFDVEIARGVAAELGYAADQISWIEAPSPQRETMLETNQVDLIVAAYTISDARSERVSFAGPYLIAGQGLLVRADETDIIGPGDLVGRSLCSVAGSTPAHRVAEMSPGVELAEVNTYSECLPKLVDGTIDAITTDDAILAGYAAQSTYAGKLKLAGLPFSQESYGVGLGKGETELCLRVNDALNAMIDNGVWDAAVRDAFGPAGFTPGPGNPPVPAECN